MFLSLVPRASSVILLGGDHSRSSTQQNKQILNGTPIIITTPASLNSKFKQGVLRFVQYSLIFVIIPSSFLPSELSKLTGKNMGGGNGHIFYRNLFK